MHENEKKYVAEALGYRDWDDATDYRLSGEEDRRRDQLLATFLKYQGEVLGPVLKRHESLETHLRNAIRIIETFVDEGHLGDVSGPQGEQWPLLAEYLSAMKLSLQEGLEATCRECDGVGAQGGIVAVCCCNPLPSGECCSNPVPEEVVEPCDMCGGSGKYPHAIS